MVAGSAPGSVTAESLVKDLGRQCGFGLVRIGGATVLHAQRLRYLAWIADGRQAEMRWIDRDWALAASAPQSRVPDARSVISVALPYWSGSRPRSGPSRGRIARYTWGEDYHRVLGERLQALSARLEQELGGEHAWYVDTGPAMDKALSVRSGLGWYGKNTNVLTEQYGSFVLLGEIITTLPLVPDPPLQKDCGSCRLCLLACPTGALGPEYSIDSRKCISYLTIEHRGPIPVEYRRAMGDWVFGCDICQDVCPPTMRAHLPDAGARRSWAREVRAHIQGNTGNLEFHSDVAGDRSEGADKDNPLFASGTRPDVDLIWLLQLTHDEYLKAFRRSAIRRAKVWMLRRNAAIALGNVGDERAIEPLCQTLVSDDHPLVRGHAAWALGQLGVRLRLSAPLEALRRALGNESDLEVQRELEAAVREVQLPE